MDRAVYPCDLHTHTNRSDGNDSPAELIALAAEAGVRILALTDHDIAAPETIVADGGVVSLTGYAASKGVALLRGIEFSCDTEVDDVHIIALGCDFSRPFFEREHRDSIRSKLEGYQRLCELLTADGLAIDWERDILLLGERSETAVQRKHIFEAMAQKGYVNEWSDAKRLVNAEAKYAVKRRKPAPDAVIAGVHEAGGIAILAHPYLIAERAVWEGEALPRAAYIDRLIEAGLDGMEARYSYEKTSYAGSLPPERIEEEVRRLYTDRVPVLSGGSDYHNEAKRGARNPRLLGEQGVTTEYFMSTPLLRGLLPGDM